MTGFAGFFICVGLYFLADAIRDAAIIVTKAFVFGEKVETEE